MVHELILSDALLFFFLRVDARPLVLGSRGKIDSGKWPDGVIA